MDNETRALVALLGLALTACGSSLVNDAPDGSAGDSGEALGDSGEASSSVAPDGGVGDSGETSTAVCSNPRVIAAGGAKVDDFEAGAARWFSYQDGTGMLKGTTVNNAPPESNSGEAPGGQYAAHWSGSGFTSYGAGLGFSGWLQCVDISAFSGVSFWAKGGPGTGTTLASGPLFNLIMPAILPPDLGGTCTAICHDYYNIQFVLTEQWQKYSFRWNQFSQMGFGTPVPFTNTNVLGFNIVFLGTPGGTSFDLWFDDIELFN